MNAKLKRISRSTFLAGSFCLFAATVQAEAKETFAAYGAK